MSKSHKELLATLNTTIEEVTKSIDNFHFNIAVASIRSLFNAISSYKILNNDDKSVILHNVKKLLILINPMVPHIAEALWENLNEKVLIANESWPIADKSFGEKHIIKIPVQVNGKMRAIIEVQKDLNNDQLKQIALKEKNILKFLNDTPKKIIIVPNRIVNFVI